jgi:hypothetical protein
VLIEVKATLRLGDTLVPLIFKFDRTHLSNFAGDKKEWPVYMTIGNLSSKIRQMPSTHAVLIVALLPIPVTNSNIPQKWLDKQRQTNQEVMNKVLRQVLQPLIFKQNPNAESRYYNVLCPDGNFRRCKPILAARLADCPDYSDIYHLKRHISFWCECPKNEHGDYVPSDKQHPRRNHYQSRMLSDTNSKTADAELSSRHVHREFNLFGHIPFILSNLPKPNLLHTMQIGMLDHLQKWIFHFMKMHEQLDKYNAIWLSMPVYHNLTSKNKSCEEVSQRNGKEMKEMSRYLLGVVTQSLRGGSPAQSPIFNHAIECTRALLKFYMYAQYKSHDDATLSYMEDALHCFHSFKDVLLIGRATKKAKPIADALRTELVKKQKVEEETKAETCTPSKKRREMNPWPDNISHEMDVSKELDADFNFPKIDLMSHWVQQIRRYRALRQYSAERHEKAHKTNLKDGWNASNHNLNYLLQVITFHRRILCCEIRKLNIQGLTQRREHTAAPCKVLHSGADLAATLSSQSYEKPVFMGPQNCRNGKHPDAMINDFRALRNNTHDATHRVAIYRGTREFI